MLPSNNFQVKQKLFRWYVLCECLFGKIETDGPSSILRVNTLNTWNVMKYWCIILVPCLILKMLELCGPNFVWCSVFIKKDGLETNKQPEGDLSKGAHKGGHHWLRWYSSAHRQDVNYRSAWWRCAEREKRWISRWRLSGAAASSSTTPPLFPDQQRQATVPSVVVSTPASWLAPPYSTRPLADLQRLFWLRLGTKPTCVG